MNVVRDVAMPRVRPVFFATVRVLSVLRVLGLAAGALLAPQAFAQSASYAVHEKALERVNQAQNVGPLQADAFGDQLSLYNGTVEFNTVDISVPGNNDLPVELRRRYSIEDRREFSDPLGMGYLGGFGEWDIDVPYLKGTFSAVKGWQVAAANPYARCSSVAPPPSVSAFATYDYWHGYSFHAPGEGDSILLSADNDLVDPVGGTYPWTTKSMWRFSCLSQTKNGYPGEGFLAVSPSGVKYYLDYVVTRQAPSVRSGWTSNPQGLPLAREHVYFLVSRIDDRFGNRVDFTYSSGKLTRIEAVGDGRYIQLTYSGRNVVSAASNQGTWAYQYGSNGRLQHVVLPDGSKWTFAADGVLRAQTVEPLPFDDTVPDCPAWSTPESGGSFDYTVTHPGGATAAYAFGVGRHYRHNVPKICQKPSNTYEYVQIPNYTDAFTLLQKTVTGPGIGTPMVWTYDYGNGWSIVWEDLCATTFGCPATKTHEISGPDGTFERYTYGILYGINEGQLLKKEVGSSASNILKTTTNSYLTATEVAAQPFEGTVGYDLMMFSDTFSNAMVRPLKSSVITQQNTTFSSTTDTYDVFARPLKVTKSSSLGFTRVEETAYHDNYAAWVLGQTLWLKCLSAVPVDSACNGDVVVETTYHPTTALPTSTKQFGKLQQTLTYYADGTLKTHKDGNNNVTTLSSWYRGVPRLVAFPDATTQSATVNASGTIATITNEVGAKTCYGYDAMGRVASITYPSETEAGVCNTSAWAATTHAFAQVMTSEYGIPAGHWRQQVSTGNGHKFIYFDALWRPVLTREYDGADVAGTQRFVRTRHDHEGRNTFTSYPSASSSAPTGTETEYDTIGRVRFVRQHSELGTLTTTTNYPTGAFHVSVTNPAGKVTTTTSFKAWDQPIYDFPMAISHPESVGTAIDRDAFGKTQAVSRAGAGTSLTRTYGYNNAQELCRQAEPETGVTVMGYDGAGNLSWSATGLPTTITCATSPTNSTLLARKATRTYDTRNRPIGLAFPDGLGDTTTTYTPDGLPEAITAYNGPDVVTTTYTYNNRRLLELERMTWNTIDWPIDYAYDANGHLASQLSHGVNVTYAPNALGQPTQAGAYASNVSYFPNGALKQFTYGSGVVHTLTQNARGLPERSRDAYGSTAFHDDTYDYDANGNVVSITDAATGRNQRGNRDMSYDGLDRLTQVVSPMFGTATYAYDALDNLTRVAIGGFSPRNHWYCYDGSNRLTNVKTSSCSGPTVIGMGYDVQGNVLNKNGATYAFDFGNRLRASDAGPAAAYVYDALGRRVRDAVAGQGNKYSLYSQTGQLVLVSDGHAMEVQDYVYLSGSLLAARIRDVTNQVYRTEYYHTDALGSAVVLTDANRHVVALKEYEPYGKTAVNDDRPGYTGHVMDASSGLIYMQQRYYDPALGVFLSVDPVTALDNLVVHFNRYRYANSNPYSFADPDGRCGSRIKGNSAPNCTTIQMNPAGAATAAARMMAQSMPLPRPLPGVPAPGSGPFDDHDASDTPPLLNKMASEIEKIVEKVQGPQGTQYSLRAIRDNLYPNRNTGGVTYLRKGEVWKYGETTRSDRYSAAELKRMGLVFVPEYYGGKIQIRIAEKFKIYSYRLEHNGARPPGNRIDR